MYNLDKFNDSGTKEIAILCQWASLLLKDFLKVLYRLEIMLFHNIYKWDANLILQTNFIGLS